MPKLILIDGSSYLYRAFHALPPLSNARGEATGALFGVVNMLRATLKAKPDYLAFVSDAPGPTFRDALYAQYKANRPPMPDDLRSQVEPMLAIVAALGFPILRVGGVEADDVIGTLALQAQAQGIEVEVSTSDKDMAQLVGSHVTLVNTMSNTVLDSAGVMEKFGVMPAQIIDFLALTGDAIDNIPGVPKCGPKTAARWLGEYGSLDGVIAHADRIGGKIGESLRATLPQLPLSRQLATIKTDVPLEFGPTDLARREADVEQLRELYTRYEFKAALKELDSAAEPAGAHPVHDALRAEQHQSHRVQGALLQTEFSGPGEYELVTTQARFDAWLEELRGAELIAFDTETTSLDAMRADIVGLSFAVELGRACYLPLGHDYPGVPPQLDRDDVLRALKPIFEDATRPKLGQHAKYDINILSHYGIAVQGLKHDSMLESYVWNATATRHDMDSLAKKYLGYDTVKYEDVAGKGARQISFSQVELDTACRYAAEDADVTLRLHHALWPKLESVPALRRVYEEIEIPLVPVLAEMERRGVLIDGDELRRQSQQLGRRMLELQQQSYALAGREFNLDSPKQLQAVLFDELHLEAKLKTPTGQPSTNEEALEAIADTHELPRLILDYRGLAKLRSTYTDKLSAIVNPRTGRVHTSYHQGSVATGRISSSDPNLQNIPVRTEEGRRIRQAFIAPPGWRVMAADYSQIELRIMAHLSGDEGLLKAFREGGDVHRATAAEVFGLKPEEVSANQRRAAKAINFGLMYGMSAFGLARQLGVDRAEAGDYMARYFARYPGVHAFMEATRERAHHDGYVETIFGRRLYLENLNARNQALRQGAERAAVNAPMQGSAADIIKRAMIAVAAWLKDRDDAHMLMQVHDELVFEVRADAVDTVRTAVVARMSGAAELAVPLLVDVGVGANWDEAH
ncbi:MULTISPECIES: DNA polymerase I [Rhodanobacter]|uniref:DNA polymerase I n=1 Tax=Rhodanobacter TaxID=75309 RepID=UPI000260EF15|nr:MULTISPECIES: DNA polymerase I [Rhodanobacter]EIL98947.1 DNA polymerase I [Rhodanobacter denitrificans]KZC19161.1 DNA polymerase I [Rhodanobacter denitrificans]UJJ51426.1 DNA polymerase I [Rhodanobacter denitrificans]UJM90628.1 DNA polymerase I [Rhodanobacter denitrificans]UJM94172.1 DNA polymerase I [Rhodanobacter denitrificans]